MRLLAVNFLVLNSFFGIAGEIKYPASAIPEELKSSVDVVIREDHMTFTIISKSKAHQYVHFVATILNENGNGYAEAQVDYGKLTKVIDISGSVYDATGNQVKRLKNKDIFDRAAFDGVSLFSDARLKALNLSQATYPYTVEIEYELEMNYLYSIPKSIWGGERVSYQNASYELSRPVGFPITYKLMNLDDRLSKKVDSGIETLTWRFENLLPIKLEPFGPPDSELMRSFIAVPNEFEYSGYLGKRDNWENFGKWQIDLNRGRDVLPEKTIAMAKDLVKGASTTEEKVKLLYEYLQSRTRYVSIQLGIGGYQPFEAKLVDEVGYGDCKALSNYMVSLLKAVGIKGYYTWIYGGAKNQNLVPGITVDIFNHIVVSVPNGKDTLWLECTSQTNPFGFQGTFTGDRWALMITDEGGKLVHTINYTSEQNVQSRTAKISIDEAGNAKAKVRTTAKGIQYENRGLNWTFNDSDKQKKWIEENTEIPNFGVNSFSIKEIKDKIPSAIVSLDLILSRYASVSGKRLFLSPNLMNKNSYVPPKIEDRKTDVVRRNNYLDLDTIYYAFPESLYPEFLPEPIKINSRFGEYEASFQFDAGKVTYIRRMKVWKGRFPKETYNELVDFYKNVSKADNIKLVFLNKT